MPNELSTEPIHQLTMTSTDGRSPEESIAMSIIPWPRDDDKCRYLGLRASYFTRREAVNLMGIANSTVSNWRLDPQFTEIEDNIQQYQKKLSEEFVGLEFTRNFRLAMEKDKRVFIKSLMSEEELEKKGESWTKADQEYLLKMRGQYSPQMLKAITDLITGKDDGKDFSWSDVVNHLSQTQGRIAMEWGSGDK